MQTFMRIEFVTDTYLPDINGVAMTLGRLVEGLQAKGHYVHVIRSGPKTQKPRETAVASVSLPGYKEVKVGLPQRSALWQRWKKRRPDLVYVATESPLGASAIQAANHLGIPIISGFHTNFHQYLKDYRLSGLQASALKYLKKWHNRTGLTLAPTEEVKQMLKNEGFERVEVMGRGVDSLLFNPNKRSDSLRASWGVEADERVVLMVGRIAAEKNLPFGIETFWQMRLHDPKLKCVIVGDGPIRERLEKAHPELRFVGALQGEALAAAYASADILLFPSESETFGNVLLEALASGLITVSYDYAAARTWVTHQVNGLKAEKGNESAFFDQAILALDLEKQWPMRISARDSILSISWENIILGFENHCLELIASMASLSKRRLHKGLHLEVRTLILSDIHLGTPDSKVREVIEVIKRVRCEKLILNGDIIDAWALKRGSAWLPIHTRFVRAVLKKMEKERCEVIYLRGNHDDILERFLPVVLDRLKVVKEHLHVAADGTRYHVVHGDGFDSVSTNHKWLAVVGSVGYDWLLVVNRWYNRYRAWCGKEYYSVSQAIKAKVKGAVNFVGRYEEQLQKLAELKDCQGIICGHIHTPADKFVGKIRYLNSGDWVESLTCLIEDSTGKMEVISYENILQRLHEPTIHDFPIQESLV